MSSKDQFILARNGIHGTRFPGQVILQPVVGDGILALDGKACLPDRPFLPGSSTSPDAWQRPRGDCHVACAPENQSCPVLVLAGGSADRSHCSATCRPNASIDPRDATP